MLKIFAVGKMKNSALSELAQDYLTRLNRYANTELMEIKDSSPEKEAQKVSTSLKNFRGKVYALGEEGKELSSMELSKLLENDLMSGSSAFLIGGPYGISKKFKTDANNIISLSRMTFTHEMARVLLLEQLYRAKSISAGSGYHHE